MYTTLSPCDMCTGACVMYKVGRVVIGENDSFMGGDEYLKQRGIEVVVLGNEKCRAMMQKYIDENPEVWYASLVVATIRYVQALSQAGIGTRTLVCTTQNHSRLFSRRPLISYYG